MTLGSEDTGRDTVHIDLKHHDLYSELVGGEAPFKTMKDLFMLAASVGCESASRTPLSRRQLIFRWPQFSSQEDIPVLRAMAIAETGDTSVLIDQDQLLTIAEEYANSGIEQISLHVVSQPGAPLENVVHFLMSGGEWET